MCDYARSTYVRSYPLVEPVDSGCLAKPFKKRAFNNLSTFCMELLVNPAYCVATPRPLISVQPSEEFLVNPWRVLHGFMLEPLDKRVSLCHAHRLSNYVRKNLEWDIKVCESRELLQSLRYRKCKFSE